MEGAFLVLGQVRVGMQWGRAGVFVMCLTRSVVKVQTHL